MDMLQPGQIEYGSIALNGTEPDAIRVVPVRRYGQWASAAILAGLAVWLCVVLAQNKAFRFSAVPEYLFSDAILSGLLVTVELTVAAQAIGLFIGILIAIMRTSDNPVLKSVSWIYVWLFRGTPVLVQLVFWFNISLIFPSLTVTIPWGPTLYSVPTNVVITGFTAALLGLGLNEGAYMSEIVRAGLLSVDRGQLEAAQALGFTRMKTLREVVLPQAMRIIIPPTGNQLISMLKTTALVSVIAGGDLLTKSQNLYSMNFLVLELLVVASIWYIVLTTIASWVQSYLERRLEAAHGNVTSTATGYFPNWRKLSGLVSGDDHER